MEDASEHCAEVSCSIISEIVGYRGHRLSHRQLLQGEHQPVLTPPDSERHACVAKKQARKRTFAGRPPPLPSPQACDCRQAPLSISA